MNNTRLKTRHDKRQTTNGNVVFEGKSRAMMNTAVKTQLTFE